MTLPNTSLIYTEMIGLTASNAKGKLGCPLRLASTPAGKDLQVDH